MSDRDEIVAAVLRALHHPELRWTTHRVRNIDASTAGNTEGDLVWLSEGRNRRRTARVHEFERAGTPVA